MVSALFSWTRTCLICRSLLNLRAAMALKLLMLLFRKQRTLQAAAAAAAQVKAVAVMMPVRLLCRADLGGESGRNLLRFISRQHGSDVPRHLNGEAFDSPSNRLLADAVLIWFCAGTVALLVRRLV